MSGTQLQLQWRNAAGEYQGGVAHLVLDGECGHIVPPAELFLAEKPSEKGKASYGRGR